ncbi:helix-hairpin-helix domain-containing protein [Bacillus sp. JJ1562]|uniref:helix-hairpin-helix domain-containing protein n=1 Tax=Bacillus sp. JJ1562 TaxID=3122960 RepID=UPI0030022A2E
MSLVKDLLSICDAYVSRAWYVGEAISQKKLNRMISEFPIPPEDEVLAVLDGTVFGSCKYGFAVCKNGLYVNQDWTATVRKGYLSWDDFVNAEIVAHGKYEVDVSSSLVVNFAVSGIKQEELIALLKHLQSYFVELSNQTGEKREANPPSLPVDEPNSEKWMLAIEGEQYGPYSTGMVKEMISSGQVKAEVTYGWKQGMEQWRFLHSLSDFGQQTSAPMTPPPLPGMTTTETTEVENENVGFVRPQEGTLDLNTATVEDLLSLPGIDLKVAEKFIEERTKRTGFTHFHEVRKVMNLQPHQFEQIRKSTTLQPLRSNVVGRGRVIDF